MRTVGACSTHTAPRASVVINSPASIAQICTAGGAAFGPPLTTTGMTGNVVLADRRRRPRAVTRRLHAAHERGRCRGKIALVDRGTCGFTVKVKNAQNAGAIAVVVANNVRRRAAAMGGVDPTITIPSLRITLLERQPDQGRARRGSTVNVTLRVGPVTASEDSYRWLMGEDSTAFGGAIRDMWNPNCLNDPGKVTDAEYHCTPDDGGGVHTNSGVPNHGYALLVDGGTYNGQTVSGDRPDEGRAPLLAGAVRLPDADDRVRGPRRRAGGVLHRT